MTFPSASYGKLIACDPIMGLPRVPPETYRPDRADLLSEMARLGVDRAIVRHQAALEGGPLIGNNIILEEVKDCTQLLASWFVTPDGFEPDFDPAKMIRQMIQAKVRICWTDPEAETFSPRPWCAGPLYEALQERRAPLLLDYSKVKPDDLAVILNDFPGLRLILLNAPRLGRNRLIYPLLKRHANLWLCLSHSYSVHEGIEDLCRNFGDERWVFGLGYPAAEGGAALAGLSYANIADKAKTAIAHGNIERLLAEVALDE